ncbi:MAG TPA: hypothetical protein VK539_26855 [Myxococcaceae bacterium]|nr:hypothetical protein [Myxococcaceae bacterium]
MEKNRFVKFALVLPESIGELLQYLSVDYHFANIARGVLDTRDVLFYLSLTAVGLCATWTSSPTGPSGWRSTSWMTRRG